MPCKYLSFDFLHDFIIVFLFAHTSKKFKNGSAYFERSADSDSIKYQAVVSGV